MSFQQYVKRTSSIIRSIGLVIGGDGLEDGEPRTMLRIPDSFLGGSAPRLRSLDLSDISFPGLPELLLSATHVVELHHFDIPRSGYISPKAMATSLSALTSLEYPWLCFRYPRPLSRSPLESRHPPPPPLTRSIPPSLTRIVFKGASEYLEKILARIDAPRLDIMYVTLFNQIIFNTPQLSQFISRRPMLREPKEGHIIFGSNDITVRFSTQTSDLRLISVQIPCTASEWHASFHLLSRSAHRPCPPFPH